MKNKEIVGLADAELNEKNKGGKSEPGGRGFAGPLRRKNDLG